MNWFSAYAGFMFGIISGLQIGKFAILRALENAENAEKAKRKKAE